jgi:IclR family transcriptional regulator, KDG regulon repressor
MATSIQNKSILQSVRNGLLILKLFSKDKPMWGTTEISRELQLPKSTVSRIITDLLNEGYLKKINRKYSLGLSILSLTGVIMSQLELHREAFDPLKFLVNKIGETANICVLEGTNLTYMLKVECKHAIRLLSHVGHYRPPSCSSAGKLLLAFQTTDIVEEVIKAGLPQRGPKSVIDPKQLLQQLQTIRQEGYAVCIDEMYEDVVSIAAPIRDYTGKVIAAVTTAAPKHRISEASIPFITKELVKTGKLISNNLGFMELGYEKEKCKNGYSRK